MTFPASSSTGPRALLNATIPAGLRPSSFTDESMRYDIALSDGKISDILPAGNLSSVGEAIDLKGQMVWPCFADIHTHLDKAFIWERTPNPDGTFMGALQATTQDREGYWTDADVERRMEFSLNCAYAHGTSAIRTHLDTFGTHGNRVWPLLRRLQKKWYGKVALQGVSLTMPERYMGEDRDGIVRNVAETEGGVLGAVLMKHNTTPEALEVLFGLATEYGLELDLHVDENGETDGTALELIAKTALKLRFRQKILCGHCCSLSVQSETQQTHIISLLGEAGIGIVSLPLCNMYLQDRTAGRTPRWRGVTLLQELDAAGIPVMLASDNVRDPFYAYGDFDMHEILQGGTRIGQLDHTHRPWAQSVTSRPGSWMGRTHRLGKGAPADLIIFPARSMNEWMSRSQAGRTVLRNGRILEATPPSYETLGGEI